LGKKFEKILINVDSELRRREKTLALDFEGLTVKLFLFIQSEKLLNYWLSLCFNSCKDLALTKIAVSSAKSLGTLTMQFCKSFI